MTPETVPALVKIAEGIQTPGELRLFCELVLALEDPQPEKFEPITVVIGCQEDLKRIHALAASWRTKPASYVLQHIHGWARRAWAERREEIAAAK